MEGASDPRFRALIELVGARAFDESRDVIYGLWPDLRLAYTNAAWTKFARENDGEATLGAWSLGRWVPEAFGPALEGFYARAFSEALARGTVWEHTYSCPSPDVNRWYAMRVLPIEGQGLMVCHSLVAEEAFVTTAGSPPDASAYTGSAGFVMQCCHCRRVRAVNSSEPDRWDFIPAMLRRSDRRTSHALCPICFAYHYYKYLEPAELRAALGVALDDDEVKGLR